MNHSIYKSNGTIEEQPQYQGNDDNDIQNITIWKCEVYVSLNYK